MKENKVAKYVTIISIIIACAVTIILILNNNNSQPTYIHSNSSSSSANTEKQKNNYTITTNFDGVYTFKEYTSNNTRTYIYNIRSFSI